jgi:hypothetical protein
MMKADASGAPWGGSHVAQGPSCGLAAFLGATDRNAEVRALRYDGSDARDGVTPPLQA